MIENLMTTNDQCSSNGSKRLHKFTVWHKEQMKNQKIFDC